MSQQLASELEGKMESGEGRAWWETAEATRPVYWMLQRHFDCFETDRAGMNVGSSVE